MKTDKNGNARRKVASLNLNKRRKTGPGTFWNPPKPAPVKSK